MTETTKPIHVRFNIQNLKWALLENGKYGAPQNMVLNNT